MRQQLTGSPTDRMTDQRFNKKDKLQRETIQTLARLVINLYKERLQPAENHAVHAVLTHGA